MPDLAGRVVLVTGGNSGIGLAVAEAVAAAGADVAIWGRDEAKTAAAASAIEAHGRRVATERCDVTAEDDVRSAFRSTVRALGRVDAVFANAGASRWFTPFAETTYDEWRSITSVNLDGAFLCLREAVRHLVERGGGGSLVTVSSLAALSGAPRGADYAASKAGVIAVSKSLAVELARHRIRSNSLVVGWVETEMNRPFVERPGAVDAVTARSPLRRFLEPAELGAAAVFLADPTLVAHTGDVVTVDGGYRLA